MNTGSVYMERLSAARNGVFNNDIIRDIIVDYVIHDKDKAVISEVCSARQVSAAWLHSVSRTLRQSRKMLFRIPLTLENFSVGTAYVEQYGGILDQFEKLHTLGLRKPCIPLYAIRASSSYFQDDNHQRLVDFLAKHGSHLVDAYIPFGYEQILSPLKSGTSLSSLRVLRLCVTQPEFMDPAVDFLQSLFDACERLESLKVVWHPDTESRPPKTLSNLRIPKTVRDMTFVCPQLENQLDVLLRNALPNLRTLSLLGSIFPFTAEHISGILENHRQTLECLSVREATIMTPGGPRRLSTFTMPVMPVLKRLKIETRELQLATDDPAIQHLLPVVQHLTLMKQTMFCGWTRHSRFDSATSLTVCCRNTGQSWLVDAPLLHFVPTAFPNLSKLSLITDILEAEKELAIVWQHLTRLRELRICFFNHVNDGGEHFWDEIFTGFSMSQLKALKDSHESSRNELLLASPDPSIRNLIHLEKLHLEATVKPKAVLTSDITFRFAFLKMPKLSTLVLLERLPVSKEMTEAWIKDGRTIEYHSTSRWDAVD